MPLQEIYWIKEDCKSIWTQREQNNKSHYKRSRDELSSLSTG